MALFDFTSTLFTNTFIFQNFIPFIILFAIFWGLLEAIHRLSSRVNLVISLGFALIAAFTNPWILVYIATLGSYTALVLFGLLFVFGVIRWGLGRGRDIYYDTASKGQRLERLYKEKEKWTRKFEEAPEGSSKRQEIDKKIRDIDNQISVLQREAHSAGE